MITINSNYRRHFSDVPLNQILYGPPGTGKTYNTVNTAVEMLDPDFFIQNAGFRDKLQKRFSELKELGQIEFVTFHKNYGYEDFVEGIKSSIEYGKMSQSLEDGIFKKICKRARNTFQGTKSESGLEKLFEQYAEKKEVSSLEIPREQKKPHLLIIDEINHGDISKIFGELITLIEESKREGSLEAIEVTLPNSKEIFSVPNNVYILGTMNTDDESIASLNPALRRRFEFVEMMPIPKLLEGRDIEGISLTRLLEKINKRIEYLYNKDHCIGHAYLMEANSIHTLRRIFFSKIIPILLLYFSDDLEKIDWIFGQNGFIQEKKDFSETEVFGKNFPEKLSKNKKFREISNPFYWTSEQFIKIYE